MNIGGNYVLFYFRNRPSLRPLGQAVGEEAAEAAVEAAEVVGEEAEAAG